MNHLHNFAIIVVIALLSAVSVQAQGGTDTTKHFGKGGIAFDYPDGWNLTETSLGPEQVVTIQPHKGPTEIVVSTQNISSCDFQAEAKNIMSILVERVAQQIHSAFPIQSSVARTQVDAADIAGVRLAGVARGKPVTADVFSIRLHQRSISLVYVRVENDKAATSAWDTVRTSLKVEPGVMTIRGTETPSASDKPITGGVLNGRAIRLPAPKYPAIARKAHASGVVTVQVTIDESGAVIAAHAVDGHPLLQAVSVAAARQAQFSPTRLCDEPVRVTGVITYNFVAI